MAIDLAFESVEVGVAGVELSLQGVEARAEGAVLGTGGGHALLEADLPQRPLRLRPGVLGAERVEREVEDTALVVSDVASGVVHVRHLLEDVGALETSPERIPTRKASLALA